MRFSVGDHKMWWYRIQVQLFNKVEYGFSILHVDNYIIGSSRILMELVARDRFRSAELAGDQV